MSQLYFRKSQRLNSEEDFKRVLSAKSFVCRGILRLYRAKNDLDFSRFGVSISKSCGNAVTRNRLKRLGREVFRIHQHEIPAGFDYILIFTNKMPKTKTDKHGNEKKDIRGIDYREIEQSFLAMTDLLGRK